MNTNTLIIGCGIAGAAAALRLSKDPQHHVTIITRAAQATDSNTHWAQGGIVTRGLDDSPELLVKDILHAGAGLSSLQAAHILATAGPQLVQSVLVERCGVHFDQDAAGQPIYGLEAAHSTRRIVHISDKTGQAISSQLLATLQACPNITLLTKHTAVDLLIEDGTCVGAVVWDRTQGTVEHIHAGQTLLATGGLGQLYAHTSNPSGARGDGIAMAHRAGACIDSVEYIQFHPTALYTDSPMKPLISEAVRGEGAILLTPDGERFMSKYAPVELELAPRDVVARAIHQEMTTGDYDYVLLDIASQRDATFIRERFPTLVENAACIGLDATRNPLPVVPVAHYSCGGVRVDEWGRTSIPGLYAIGEVNNTGLHGANRLASTSLLEGLVWGDRAARHISENLREQAPTNEPVQLQLPPVAPDQIAAYWHQMQRIMWENVGIVRTEAQLAYAKQMLAQLSQEVALLYRQSQLDDRLIGLRNALQTAYLVASAAYNNPISRGAHYRADTAPTIQATQAMEHVI